MGDGIIDLAGSAARRGAPATTARSRSRSSTPRSRHARSPGRDRRPLLVRVARALSDESSRRRESERHACKWRGPVRRDARRRDRPADPADHGLGRVARTSGRTTSARGSSPAGGSSSATTTATPASRSRTTPGTPATRRPTWSPTPSAWSPRWGLPRAHLVGMSTAGRSRRSPPSTTDRVASLTLISTSAMGPGLPGMTDRATACSRGSGRPSTTIPRWWTTSSTSTALASEPFDADGTPRCGSAPSRARTTSSRCSATTTSSRAAWAGRAARRDRRADAVIHGDDDPFMQLPHGEALARQSPAPSSSCSSGPGTSCPDAPGTSSSPRSSG